VHTQLDRRLSSAHETALYFVAAEALRISPNVRTRAADVTLRVDDDWAEITVADDGVGGAKTNAGGGLRGLCDRVEALGGHLTLVSAAAGTSVQARVALTTDSTP
jgi:signal transduction histidine kinase